MVPGTEKMNVDISHFDLCKKTAEWAIKKNDICLWEYATNWSYEQPDVLAYKYIHTTLYEIKVSRADFLKDKKKSCRQSLVDTKKTIKAYIFNKSIWDQNKSRNIKELVTTKNLIIKQQRHLGRLRYYVCPSGMIQPEEVDYFGLYWYKNGRFFKKKESNRFIHDLKSEMALIIHALYKKNSVENTQLITRAYVTQGLKK